MNGEKLDLPDSTQETHKIPNVNNKSELAKGKVSKEELGKKKEEKKKLKKKNSTVAGTPRPVKWRLGFLRQRGCCSIRVSFTVYHVATTTETDQGYTMYAHARHCI
jgi:hypothetical protein